MRAKRVLTSLVLSAMAATTVGLVMPGIAYAEDKKTVTAQEATDALADAGLLNTKTESTTTADSDSAGFNRQADAPKNIRNGIKLRGANGMKLTITVPNADSSDTGRRVSSGTVVYPSKNNVANVAQIRDNDVRLMTVIDNADAPTTYTYKLSSPGGVVLKVNDKDGSVAVLKRKYQDDLTKGLITVIPAPFAKDATGKAVATWYTVDGSSLTQHVDHQTPGITYPVIADPSVAWNWWGFQIRFSKWETQVIGWGIGAVGVYFGWTGWAAVAALAAEPAAQWASSHGYCLALNHYWSGFNSPWLYRC